MSPADVPRNRRTPQACHTCRRRKTKCDGVRPRCRHCTNRGVPCLWSSADEAAIHSASSHEGDSHPRTPVFMHHGIDISSSSAHLPSKQQLQRCFDIFFDRYLQTCFCSFLFQSDFEETCLDMPFITTAMVCLCSKHLTTDEASFGFGLADGKQVSAQYTDVAKTMSKMSSDEPSVQNIQANLILALSELIEDAGSSHWMYAGTAIRMAQVMRLNKEYHTHHTIKEQETRRRVFWACLLFDRLLAYVLTKPQTLRSINIAVFLPSTDSSVAYQDKSRGLTLKNIDSFAGLPSDIGILPYLIRTIFIWGEIAELHICNRRFLDDLPPTESTSDFHKRHQIMHGWETSLAPIMQWTTENYEAHVFLGQGSAYTAMQFLVRSSFTVAHQSYLPQLDGSSILFEKTDAAGWSLLHRESSLITMCVTNALGVGQMLSMLWEKGDRSRRHLQSIWVAASLLSVANTYLWLLYSSDPEYSTPDICDQAKTYFDLILVTISSWGGQWKVASVWTKTLREMQSMYQTAYQGTDSTTNFDYSLNELLTNEETAAYRPQPGDGYMLSDTTPTLYSSLRLLMGDMSAKHKLPYSVWLYLSQGWPQGVTADDSMTVTSSLE